MLRQIFRLKLPSQTRQLSSAIPPYKERKIKVLDLEINCIETVENAANAPPIFYLPGVFGSIEMDFKPILHEFNREKYKWICWDPPGYGGSRPPNRRGFISNNSQTVHYELDVQYVTELMNIMGYPKYTVLAWSGAAITAIMLAAKQPEKVSGLITWGAFGYVGQETIPGMATMKKLGLGAIPEPRKTQLLNMYGEKCLLEMWNGWCDEGLVLANSETFKKDGSYQNVIRSVQCPALVIHGMKDRLIGMSYAQHLKENLRHSRLHVIEKGTHNLHLRETKEFAQCIQQFVDSSLSSKL